MFTFITKQSVYFVVRMQTFYNVHRKTIEIVIAMALLGLTLLIKNIRREKLANIYQGDAFIYMIRIISRKWCQESRKI